MTFTPARPVAGLLAAAIALTLLGLATEGEAVQRAAGTGTLAQPIAAGVAIEAPETVDPVEEVTVTVTGAQGGSIEVWGPIGLESPPARLATLPLDAGRASFTAPGQPGSYELRYIDEKGRTRARFTLDVAAVPVVLRVTNLPLGVRQSAVVEWLGPARPGDRLEFYDPAGGRVATAVAAEGSPGRFNTARVPTPEEPGRYLLRYVDGRTGAPLRAIPVEVASKGLAWLETPIEVHAGERFTVVWHGEVNPDQAAELADPATGDTLASAAPDEAGRATLRAPARAGRYVIRYVDRATGFVYTELPLDVDPR